MGSATTETLTAEQIAAELRELKTRLGMTVDMAEVVAAADAMDADRYQALRRIRELEWLQNESPT